MDKQWYVVNTYSGHEQKVKEKIESKIESMGMQDIIYRIIIPETTEVEIKDGVKKEKTKKMFPGYILVEMVMTDEAWYIIRNTPGVTGFVGTGTQPTPVSEKEIKKIKKRMGVEDPKFSVKYEVGEVVSITDGPFKGFDGSISEIDAAKGKIKVMVSMFGRETPVELDALQVKQLN